MLFRNQAMKYYEEAGDDGAAGGGAGETKTYTEAQVEEMTRGLRESRDALLAEKKKVSAEAKAAEAARLAAEQEAAKKTGELDRFEASLRSGFEKEKEPLVAKLSALETKVLSSERKAVLGAFAADFVAAESIDLVAQLVKTEFDGENIKTQFVDFSGTVITTDPAEFKKWMAKHPAISHLMKADAASGGGATGSKTSSGGAASNDPIQLRLNAKYNKR